MNAWPFVIAAYAVTLGGTAAIFVWSYVSMRCSEAAVDEMRER